MGTLLEVIANHREAASRYHDQKENSAFAATALYLSGAAVWLLSETFWTAPSSRRLNASTIVTLIAGAVVFAFASWQLRRRVVAATIEAACVNLMATISAGGPVPSTTPAEWNRAPGLQWPSALVDELTRIHPTVRRQTAVSSCTTAAVIVLVTLLLLGRIWVEGHP